MDLTVLIFVVNYLVLQRGGSGPVKN